MNCEVSDKQMGRKTKQQWLSVHQIKYIWEDITTVYTCVPSSKLVKFIKQILMDLCRERRGGMAQWEKCLLYKCGDLSSDQ